MKRILFVMMAVVCGVCAYSQSKVVAHRGYWKTEGSAQNSIRALVKADSIGCWGSEFDVWMTADGKLVVNHDATIDGVVIEKSTAKEVLAKTLANGEHVPTLEAYLKKFDELLQVTDLFLLDIKAFDSSLHKKITGKDNKNVLELFSYLDKKNYPIWVRHVLVPTLSDNDERLRETHEFLSKFKNIRRVEVLPYHTLGTYKYDLLKIEYPLKDVPAPTKERVENAEKILCVKDYPDYK